MKAKESDVTATSSKLPYKAAFPPNKDIKKKMWSTRFSKWSENRLDQFFDLNPQTITKLEHRVDHTFSNAILLA